MLQQFKTVCSCSIGQSSIGHITFSLSYILLMSNVMLQASTSAECHVVEYHNLTLRPLMDTTNIKADVVCTSKDAVCHNIVHLGFDFTK